MRYHKTNKKVKLTIENSINIFLGTTLFAPLMVGKKNLQQAQIAIVFVHKK